MAHGNMKYEGRRKGNGRKFRSVLPRVPTSFSSALISPFPFFFKHLQAITCEQALHLGSREKSLESGRGKVSPLALVFSRGCFARNIKWRACLQGIGIGTRKRRMHVVHFGKTLQGNYTRLCSKEAIMKQGAIESIGITLNQFIFPLDVESTSQSAE